MEDEQLLTRRFAVASYAQDILDRCTYNVGLMRFVGGQYWDTEGYNINVYRDTSC